jgi:hypothetical protein
MWLIVICLIVPFNVLAESLLPVYKTGSGTFEKDYTIGGDIEDEDSFFFSPADVALDKNGNLFVLDYKGYCVKKFDREGTFIKTFGRQGEGPGEFMQAWRMGIDPAGNLIIYDFGNNRFTTFNNDGELVGSLDINEFGWRPVMNVKCDPTGLVYFESNKQDFADPRSAGLTLISRFDPKMNIETGVDSASIQKFYVKHTDIGITSTSVPFPPDLHWGITPSGQIAIARSKDYSIKILSTDLAILHESRFDGTRRPVTAEDKKEYFDSYEDENLAQWVRSTADFPKIKPYFDELIVDREGYLLFLVDEDEGGDTQTYDVFTPQVEFINKVTLPRLHRRAILTDGLIYTIVRPEDEDPLVVRYRSVDVQ